MRKSLILLGILDDSDVEWMLRVGIKDKITAGSSLIVEGELISSLYIVLSGQFSVTVGSGKRVATLLAGEILGEMSFVDCGRPRPRSPPIRTPGCWTFRAARSANA